MTDESRQWQLEADQIVSHDEILDTKYASSPIIEHSSGIPRSETVVAPAADQYRIPHFLAKTANNEDYKELKDIFQQLLQINVEHTGEITLEAEAFLCISGFRDEFAARINRWADRYFAQRFVRHNSKDRGYVERKFERLVAEWFRIFERLFRQEGSLDYVFLDECLAYIRWLLSCWARTGHYERPDINKLPVVIEDFVSSPLTPLETSLLPFGLVQSHLLTFAAMASQSADADSLETLALASEPDLLRDIAEAAADISEMRPFLIRNYRAENSIIRLPGEKDFYIAWDWCVHYGMANIVCSCRHEDLLEYRVSRKTLCPIKVGNDGLLRDGTKPWITSVHDRRLKEIDLVALNRYILDLFWEKLFSFYEQIDLDRIRKRSITDVRPDDDEVLALSSRDLADQQPVEAEATRTERRRLRPLRIQRLCRFLQSRFDCEVEQGKGSEVTLYRPGERKAVLGRHKRNDEVHVVRLKRLLKQLGITPQEWLAAVYS